MGNYIEDGGSLVDFMTLEIHICNKGGFLFLLKSASKELGSRRYVKGQTHTLVFNLGLTRLFAKFLA